MFVDGKKSKIYSLKKGEKLNQVRGLKLINIVCWIPKFILKKTELLVDETQTSSQETPEYKMKL